MHTAIHCGGRRKEEPGVAQCRMPFSADMYLLSQMVHFICCACVSEYI